MTTEPQPVCRDCENPEERVVYSQSGISLAALGLSSLLCSSCLRAELLARGLVVEHSDWSPVTS